MGAYRGYGQAESNYVREVLVDRLARRLGQDPADFRRQQSPAARRAAVQERQRRRPTTAATTRAASTWRSRASATRRSARGRRSRGSRGATSASACRATWSSPAIRPRRSSVERGARFGAYESVTAAHGPRRARGHLHRRLHVRAGHGDDVRPDRRLAARARSRPTSPSTAATPRARRTAWAASPAAR